MQFGEVEKLKLLIHSHQMRRMMPVVTQAKAPIILRGETEKGRLAIKSKLKPLCISGEPDNRKGSGFRENKPSAWSQAGNLAVHATENGSLGREGMQKTASQAPKPRMRARRQELKGKYGLHNDIDPEWGRLLLWKQVLEFGLQLRLRLEDWVLASGEGVEAMEGWQVGYAGIGHQPGLKTPEGWASKSSPA